MLIVLNVFVCMLVHAIDNSKSLCTYNISSFVYILFID